MIGKFSPFMLDVHCKKAVLDSITDEWLERNGHDREWLKAWLAEPAIDQEAVQEWLLVHKLSDPRLIIKPAFDDSKCQQTVNRKRRKRKRDNNTRMRRLHARQITPHPSTQKQIRERIEIFNKKCAYCGCSGKITVDHVIPLSRGGFDSAQNIVPACLRCNIRKHANPVEEWYRKQAFFCEDKWEKIKKHCDLSGG